MLRVYIESISKNFRILRFEKIGFEGALGALNVINLSAVFFKCRNSVGI